MSSTQNDGLVMSAVHIHILGESGHYSEPLEGKPARETQFDVMLWLHLPQPKLNIYVSWHVEFIQIGCHLYFSGSSYL